MNRKIKYIIYTHNAGYVKVCLSNVLSNVNFVVCESDIVQKLIIKLTYYIHIIFRKSEYLRIHRIFFPSFIKKNVIASDDTPVFFFYEFNVLSCNKLFLLHLKKIYPHSKIVLYLTNTIGAGNPQVLTVLDQCKNLYDEIITYNKEDAKKYNITYHQWFYSAVDKANVNIEYDLYFVGADKGRKEFIREIAKKCKFYKINYKIAVLSTEEDHEYDNSGIVRLKSPLPYSEYLQDVKKSRCVLELVPNGIMSCTLRTAEAVACKTKLLTNNINLKNDEVFNPNQMSVFTSIDDIDIEFINKEVDEQLFNKPENLSPESFFSFLEEKLFENADSIRE